ncbi:DUF2309 domain-containing protein [Arenibacter sp. GZD96]|uniref:DUF2309 domain-containing protein n=1 Tax=Aurantibrevibacter litoralis TaxID=3106030 RepID=UPI002AFE993F|nr:DUF2309 domain-containing protein [Arenibacter sp. GZD-96]MEA1784921.1 DUF2309 domain-containing protein [Arenibacter sp. GZD-96]
MTQTKFELLIEEASECIGYTWPLYSFVTSNPLSGYETRSFYNASENAKDLFNATVFPKAPVYRNALEKGHINSYILCQILKQKGYTNTPEYYLDLMEAETSKQVKNPDHDLDRYLVKWLSAFMDEGLAEWQMPYKSKGFYQAWRKLAPFDQSLGATKHTKIPKTSEEVLEGLLKNISDEEIIEVFKLHLSALSGWTGYIKYRSKNLPQWHKKAPIELQDYLAVRLWTSKKMGLNFRIKQVVANDKSQVTELQYLWLCAWEKSWQKELLTSLKNSSINVHKKQADRSPEVQMVFCIDTRSELIRRHVESKGPYETFGYAGFFGIPMDYQNLKTGISQKSCPPILDSCYAVNEIVKKDYEVRKKMLDRKTEIHSFWNYFLKRMKNMLPSTFGFVEGAGFFYAIGILIRTLLYKTLYRRNKKQQISLEEICEPSIHIHNSEISIPLSEKAVIVKSAFKLMGWKNFAPLVVFVGHGSQSVNNPFGSSLDCGACAARPGRHNARMLAKLANETEVRQLLSKEFNIPIPESTFFVAAEHNTTTDEILLFDSCTPLSHKTQLKALQAILYKVQLTATQERLGVKNKSVALAEKKASNWGETRPEWGLAKNASFIIAPRKLTRKINLNSRSFLHSYNWKMDNDGSALEAIMQGPMVVTQWINNHYYFSTVDNEKFGGGTKTTHNITGKFGVVQGNGGDLKMGLPSESLYNKSDTPYHLPLRLTVIIQAPTIRVNKILDKNNTLHSLIANEWLHLIIMDPENKTESIWNPSQKVIKKDRSKTSLEVLTN